MSLPTNSKRWLVEQRRLYRVREKIGLIELGAPLVLGYSGIDFFYIPHFWKRLIYVRLTVLIAVAFCIVLRNLKVIQKRYWELPGLIFLLYLGTYSAVLVAITGVNESPYYAGLNLISIAALCFMPWTTGSLILSVACIYAPYCFMVAWYASSIQWTLQLPAISFMVSTTFIGLFAATLFRRYQSTAFQSSVALRRTVHQQSRTIETKTQEALALGNLTKQFSPQVVSAIKSGSVKIDSVNRSEVSIIFIDAKGSTERATRLDHSAFLEVITDLYKNVNRILLKHDLTVGTFLGDGLLAFCNAPAKHADHVEITVNAAIEVLEFCRRKKAFYSETWRKPFTVRMGINVGYCNVGFFPSAELGTYTIIGDPVNQASRFCAIAAPDTICVPKAVLKKIGPYAETLELTKRESDSKMKGLEEEYFELFCINGLLDSSKSGKGIHFCPLCNKPLIEKARLGDTLYLICQAPCQFVDFVEAPSDPRAGSLPAKVASGQN